MMKVVSRCLKLLFLSMALLRSFVVSAASDAAADSIRLVRCDSVVQLLMQVSFPCKEIECDDVLLVVPTLVTAADTLTLPTVGLYGRNTYYHYVRDGRPYLQELGGIHLRALPQQLPYRYAATVPYAEWMDSARVLVSTRMYRACESTLTLSEQSVLCGTPRYVHHPGNRETLRAAVKRRANLDFRVNQTDILPDYHRNRQELQRIRETIDSVQRDPRSHIVGVTISGYASPEGSYANNERLARERTESLRRFLLTRYGLDSLNISTRHVAEDWEGLRAAVSRRTADNRDRLLALIDGPLEPDAKLWRLRQLFPDDYRWLQDEVFPYLRRTDYSVDYERLTDRGYAGWTDTLLVMPTATATVPDSRDDWDVCHPLMALKTNLLFDAVLGVNVEAEVPFGRNGLWSLMAEYWTPWYVWHHNSRAYELQVVGLELRRWRRRCPLTESTLTGTFYGVYAAAGKYDFEWRSVGDQGEMLSFGATIGRAWPLAKRLNLELSAGLGVVFGPRRHYHGEFGDTHLIWKRNASTFYAGPTKLKCSLVWLLGNKRRKGGAL